jgi:transposase-like protein
LVSSGRSISALAKKLGLHGSVLRRWVVKFRQSGARRPTLAYDADQAAETAPRCAAGSRCRALSQVQS